MPHRPSRPSPAALRRLALGTLLVSLFGATRAAAQSLPDYEREPLRYSASATQDRFAALKERITDGSFVLPHEEKAALRAVLTELQVPEWTQVLVFSRTSLQRSRIRPEHPRALYFSDSVYVGWVPGGLVEIAAIDPRLGPVFYALDTRPKTAAAKRARRDADCLSCHGGDFVRDIPGVFARSLFTDASGDPLLRHGTMLVTDETPFAERWGGWYVTGYHGVEPHRGNAFAAEQAERLVFTPHAARPDELSGFFPTQDYLRATSDVVALLLLEHQMTVNNALTRASHAAQRMIAYQHGLQAAFKEPITDEPAYDSVRSVFASTIDEVIDRLLFRGAAPLPAGIRGDPELVQHFARGAPSTADGRSLKQLSLDGRLLQLRCSYLIYSDSFRSLPIPLRNRLVDRLGAVLEGRAGSDRYDYLPAGERSAIRDILLATLPLARERWLNGTDSASSATSASARAE